MFRPKRNRPPSTSTACTRRKTSVNSGSIITWLRLSKGERTAWKVPGNVNDRASARTNSPPGAVAGVGGQARGAQWPDRRQEAAGEEIPPVAVVEPGEGVVVGIPVRHRSPPRTGAAGRSAGLSPSALRVRVLAPGDLQQPPVKVQPFHGVVPPQEGDVPAGAAGHVQEAGARRPLVFTDQRAQPVRLAGIVLPSVEEIVEGCGLTEHRLIDPLAAPRRPAAPRALAARPGSPGDDPGPRAAGRPVANAATARRERPGRSPPRRARRPAPRPGPAPDQAAWAPAGRCRVPPLPSRRWPPGAPALSAPSPRSGPATPAAARR